MADLSKSQQDTQKEKEMAGRAAAELVRDGDVVGLGTGSTAYFAVLALGERVKAGLKIVASLRRTPPQSWRRKSAFP